MSKMERRRFLTEGAGAMGILASLGLSRYVVAQAPSTTTSGAAHPGMPPPPPEPKVSQPAPLHDLRGKVAYITAASDGIGLGIARAASNAGMKVCVGYRNEERLKAALPLFKDGNAGVFPIKHDVTDRDGWKKALEQIKSQYGRLHLMVNNAGSKLWTPVSKATPEEWDNAVAVNFTATYNSVAVKLTATALSHSSLVALLTGVHSLLPALLTIRCNRPY